MSTTTQKPIIQRFVGILSRGRKGKRQEFDMVGVWPPDRNGIVQISVGGCECSPTTYLEMPVEHARAMARYILERTE